jgi:hypothetical protein
MKTPSRRTLLHSVAALLMAGCLSPTLPLPPPNEPNVSGPDESGTAYLTGTVPASAIVFAINHTTALGYFQQTGRDGQYNFAIRASVGDRVVFWYELNDDRSDGVEFTIGGPRQ